MRSLLFGNAGTSDIVDMLGDDSEPYINEAYKGRLLVNITDSYTSITFLRLNRSDGKRFTLTIKIKYVGSSGESAKSHVEILVTCKYIKIELLICFHYFMLAPQTAKTEDVLNWTLHYRVFRRTRKKVFPCASDVKKCNKRLQLTYSVRNFNFLRGKGCY